MACKECFERRELARKAMLRGAALKAAGHVAKGAAEMAGLKTKTASQEAESEPGDAGTEASPANTQE